MTIILDLLNVTSKKELFELINQTFKFENQCTNLDALYDELTSMTSEYKIIIKNIDKAKESINDYINIFVHVLNDCEYECNNIHILYDEVGK